MRSALQCIDEFLERVVESEDCVATVVSRIVKKVVVHRRFAAELLVLFQSVRYDHIENALKRIGLTFDSELGIASLC